MQTILTSDSYNDGEFILNLIYILNNHTNVLLLLMIIVNKFYFCINCDMITLIIETLKP